MAKISGLRGTLPTRGKGPFLFLIVVFCVMVAAMIMMSRGTRDPKPIPVESRYQPTQIAIEDPLPWDPKTELWGPVDDGNVGQVEIPVRAFNVVAERTFLNSWERFKLVGSTIAPDETGFHRLDVEKVFRSPASNRGLPVEVVGELVEIGIVDLFDTYQDFKFSDGRFKVLEGTILSRQSVHGSRVPVRFTLVHEQPNPPEVGDQVKLQGVFFKLHRVAIPAMGETAARLESGLWVIGKRLYPSFVVPAAADVDMSLLETVRDARIGADADASIFAEPPLFHAMGEILRTDPADAEVVKLRGNELRRLLEDPESYRGKVIEFQARVIKVDHHSMESFFPQNEPGDTLVHEFWNSYVTTDGLLPLTVMWVKKPSFDLQTNNQVLIRGIFYKNWAYKSGRPKRVHAPLILGLGEIQILDFTQNEGLDPLAIGIIIFTIVTVTLVSIVLLIDRRRASLFKATLRAKRQVQRGATDLNAVARQSEDGDESPTADIAGSDQEPG